MRYAKVQISLIGVVSLAAQLLQAQIGLPIPRRQPPRPPVGGPAAQQAPGRGAATVEQCKALVNWVSMLEREYPPVRLRMYPVDELSPKVVNLFRDEYFRPFYGKSFSQTTDQERQQYQMTVMRGCGPNQVTPQELAPVQKYRQALEYPFQYGSTANLAGQQFAKNLADRQALARWRDEALRGLNTTLPTLEGADRLESYRQKGEKDLDALFPSEKQRFLQAVTERRKVLAPAIGEQLLQLAAAIPAGSDGAKAIATLRARYEPMLADADPAIKARVAARMDEITLGSLSDKLKGHKAKLAAVPGGIEGALAIVGWRRDFEVEFAGVNVAPVQALRDEAAAKRAECLKAGLAEFKTLVAAYPKPGHNGRKADELMAALFPAGEAAPPEASPYGTAYTERVKQIKSDEDAKAFREEQLKAAAEAKVRAGAKPAAKTSDPNLNPCDDLAGHPGDPGHKGDGVNDAELVAADAIKACALAVKQQPKTARFRFQLGRAYWVGKQYDKAVESLTVAQGMEYAPAYHYLGLAYEQGKVKGEPADKKFATDLYKMAIAGGFNGEATSLGSMPEPAAAVIVERAEDLDAAQFKQIGWIRAFFSGDFETLNRDRRYIMSYLYGVQQFMTLDPNEYDATCGKIADPSLEGKIDYEVGGVGDGKANLNVTFSEAMRMIKMATQAPGMLAAEAQRNEDLVQNGVDDINVLSEDYGSCEGAVVKRVYNNIKRFMSSEKPKAKTLAPLSGTQDRPPQPADIKGVTDPALLARLQQELQAIAAKGFLVTECTYQGAPDKTAGFWKNGVPVLSDSLRAAMTGILPMSLAHCGKQENVLPFLRQVFLPPAQFAQITEAATTLQQVPAAALPRMLPPNQRAFQQEVAAVRTPLVSCKTQFDGMPAYYWRTSLPQVQGQVNWEFLQFVYTYWKVLPAAVNGCPPSGGFRSSMGFKDY